MTCRVPAGSSPPRGWQWAGAAPSNALEQMCALRVQRGNQLLEMLARGVRAERVARHGRLERGREPERYVLAGLEPLDALARVELLAHLALLQGAVIVCVVARPSM